MSKEEIEDIVDDVSADDTAAQQDAPAPDDAVQDDRDYEAEALDMGWQPQDKFKGDPDKWTDAKTFVERGENFIPFLRADRDKLRREAAEREAEFESRLKRMEAMTSKREAALKAQYEQQIADIEAQQRAAVESGDLETFDRLKQQQKALEANRVEDEKVETEDPAEVEQNWINQNGWYTQDFDLHRAANERSQFLARSNPKLSMAENLRQTEEWIREQHPEKFGGKPKPKPKQNGHAAVDGGTLFPGGKPTGKSANDLPAEARELCRQDIADGLYKNEAEWVKEYFANE